MKDFACSDSLLGVVVGFGLMNKHSMLFFGFGLVIGLLITPLRKHYKSPWLYAGGAIAIMIFLPNLIWQITNGWPTLKETGSGDLFFSAHF